MKNTKRLALCSVVSALGVVLLLLGSLVEVLDLTVAMLASILTVIIVVEVGGFWPWLTYLVISAVSLLVLPYKMPAFVFLLSGYYPIVKEKLERLNRVLAWAIKVVIFNASLAVGLLAFKLFAPEADLSLIPNLSPTLTYVVLFAVGNVVFVLYDIALTRIISFYIYKLRDRFGFIKRRKK